MDLPQEQHETVLLVVKSNKMGVSGGSIYTYVYIYIRMCLQIGVDGDKDVTGYLDGDIDVDTDVRLFLCILT